MALNKRSVDAAISILSEMDPDCKGNYEIHNEDAHTDDPKVLHTILLHGQKSDGGFENVYMQIKDIGLWELNIFIKRKDEVHNSYFITAVEKGLTRIGWF